ncbi:MAG: NADPH-dependent F420 reductase [Candidatus Nanopelagicales bacterium]|jgi:NADPH-dependent F420 reductase|nr:NADPH-dependent F420 reductase [Candidatus Nanopelagicales bacterium]MCU0299619.1 NADPH-dependent F420 reductase [Candidatus Nanopelagicales bacterium]
MTTIAVLGGTGPQGKGLAARWAQCGLDVVLGSRDPARAQAAAEEIGVRGAGNLEAAQEADIVLVAVPYDGHAQIVAEVADAVAGKILIDCVNPLGFDKQGPYPLPVPEGSAAQQAAAVAPQARVVAAFHHVSAVLLADLDHQLDIDIMVLAEDREAADEVIALADRIPGMRGVFAGRLRNAAQVEALTANLIAINRRYKVHAGVRVTDLP